MKGVTFGDEGSLERFTMGWSRNMAHNTGVAESSICRFDFPEMKSKRRRWGGGGDGRVRKRKKNTCKERKKKKKGREEKWREDGGRRTESWQKSIAKYNVFKLVHT